MKKLTVIWVLCILFSISITGIVYHRIGSDKTNTRFSMFTITGDKKALDSIHLNYSFKQFYNEYVWNSFIDFYDKMNQPNPEWINTVSFQDGTESVDCQYLRPMKSVTKKEPIRGEAEFYANEDTIIMHVNSFHIGPGSYPFHIEVTDWNKAWNVYNSDYYGSELLELINFSIKGFPTEQGVFFAMTDLMPDYKLDPSLINFSLTSGILFHSNTDYSITALYPVQISKSSPTRIIDLIELDGNKAGLITLENEKDLYFMVYDITSKVASEPIHVISFPSVLPLYPDNIYASVTKGNTVNLILTQTKKPLDYDFYHYRFYQNEYDLYALSFNINNDGMVSVNFFEEVSDDILLDDDVNPNAEVILTDMSYIDDKTFILLDFGFSDLRLLVYEGNELLFYGRPYVWDITNLNNGRNNKLNNYLRWMNIEKKE